MHDEKEEGQPKRFLKALYNLVHGRRTMVGDAENQTNGNPHGHTVSAHGSLNPKEHQSGQQASVGSKSTPHAPSPAWPSVGAVEAGYRFMGGHPGDRKNWERVTSDRVNRFTIAEKLHPKRFPQMGGKMMAVVGYIVEERFINPAIAELVIKDGEVFARVGDNSELEAIWAESDLMTNWKGLLDAAGLTDTEQRMARDLFRQRVRVIRKQNPSPAEPSENPENPSDYKFYRKLTAEDEALIAECLEDHPGLTREECLKHLDAAGY
jgi:hypothetical protein